LISQCKITDVISYKILTKADKIQQGKD